MPVLTVASALYWVAVALLLVRAVRSVPSVHALREPPPSRWPRVSLIMPARNEERSLESALRVKLRATYPELELVLVNDRSSDATGPLAEALARGEQRLQVVHVEHLPEGWLGKVHAMQRGLERASSEWILFSTFFRLLCAGGRLWAVPDPKSSAAISVGAFNLVRRTALERSHGLKWLKTEIGDDAALGVMLKRSGAR